MLHVVIALSVLLFSFEAQAACTGFPAGVASGDSVLSMHAISGETMLGSKDGMIASYGANGEEGMFAYDATANELVICDGTSWQSVATGSSSSQWLDSGSDIYFNSGNIGIGTSSPSDRLHLNGGRFLVTGTGYTSNPAGPIFGQYNALTGYVQAPSGGDLQIWKDDTTAIATFKESGNVGIGTTTPSSKLEVVGSDSYTVQIDSGTGGSCRMYVQPGTGNCTGGWTTLHAGTGGNPHRLCTYCYSN